MKSAFAVLAALVMAAGICLIALVCDAEEGKVWPLRWGVDTLGTPENFELQPWAAELFREFGYNFWVLHACEKPQIAAKDGDPNRLNVEITENKSHS